MLVVQGDVAKDEDCKKLAAAAAPWGRLDALVNNAGTTKHVPNHSQMDELSAEDFQRIYAVNVVGTFQMIRAARSLLEAGAKASGGNSAVVNIASVAGISGGGSSVAYAASKGALITMTKSLGRALAPSIRVNAVCPGYIDTPWFSKGRGQEAADKLREQVKGRVPLKIASKPEDIAETRDVPRQPGLRQHDRRSRAHGRGHASRQRTSDRHSEARCMCVASQPRNDGLKLEITTSGWP